MRPTLRTSNSRGFAKGARASPWPSHSQRSDSARSVARSLISRGSENLENRMDAFLSRTESAAGRHAGLCYEMRQVSALPISQGRLTVRQIPSGRPTNVFVPAQALLSTIPAAPWVRAKMTRSAFRSRGVPTWPIQGGGRARPPGGSLRASNRDCARRWDDPSLCRCDHHSHPMPTRRRCRTPTAGTILLPAVGSPVLRLPQGERVLRVSSGLRQEVGPIRSAQPSPPSHRHQPYNQAFVEPLLERAVSSPPGIHLCSWIRGLGRGAFAADP